MKRVNIFCIRLNLVLLILGLNLSAAHAFTFKTLLMPGKLIAGHAKYEEQCHQCHNDYNKKQQKQRCLACHKKVAKDLKQQKGFHGKNSRVKSQECKLCHTDHKGRKQKIVHLNKWQFNHKLTDFMLKGKHKSTDCVLCHLKDKKYRDAPSSCYACHKDDDTHHGKMGKKCQDCHNSSNWKKNRFDHDKTRFKLKQSHKKLDCAQCHINLDYKKTPKQCFACHQSRDIHKGTMEKKCQKCHFESKWSKTNFDHNKKTKFRLKGKHTRLKCTQCHKRPVSQDKKQHTLGKQCFACHQHDDIHNGINGKKCQSCHNNNNWNKADFDHNKTKFPLKGKHRQQSCFACHNTQQKKQQQARSCLACHKQDDVHHGKLGKQCQNCHQSSGWSEKVLFDHDISNFPLVGLHSVLPCESCHFEQNYQNTSSKCYSCHKDKDVHKQVFDRACDVCHNPNDWKLWRFDHNKQTKFKLDNSHKDLRCKSCHQQKLDPARSRVRRCYACHQQDDQHDGEFGTDCARCHNTNKFSEYSIGFSL